MKKGLLLIFTLSLLIACSEKEQESMFTIEGNTDTPKGMVYLYGADSRYDSTDSIACDDNGFFRLSIPADTITPLALITPDKRIVAVYGEPRLTAKLQKDSTLLCGWRVEGGKTQALHDSISRVLDACTDEKILHEKIDSFILAHPVSDVNIEIIRRYMTELPQTDHRAIRSRTGKLSGVLQDHYLVVTLKERTDNKVSNIKHRSFPTFTYTTADSIEVTQATYMKKYTLVTLWATWDPKSRESVKRLSGIKDSIESKSLAMLNISLDYDSAAWMEFITRDSIAGDNVMDNKMFNSPIVRQFGVNSLPFTILLNPYQRVDSYNAPAEGLASLLDSLTKKYDKEEEKKNKKKNNKKR